MANRYPGTEDQFVGALIYPIIKNGEARAQTVADLLTRILSLALRHKPELFSVTVDNDGWTSLPELVRGARTHFPALSITEEHVRSAVTTQTVDRFEIRNDVIRALYGHSLRHVSVGTVGTPPPLLFHSTRALLLPRIRKEGLLSKSRNGVHLTANFDYALSITDSHTQKGQRGVIVAVRTEETTFKGILFYQATEHIWLSPFIPVRFLSIVPAPYIHFTQDRTRTLIPLDSEHNRDILRKRLLNELFDDIS